MLMLDRRWVHVTRLLDSQLLLRWTGLYSARASIVGNALGCVIVDNRLVIHVVNVRYIHVVNGSVVVELSPLPTAAVIPVAGIAVTIVNATVESNRRTPVARMPVIESG
jgi:hypothetical protein